MKIFKYQRPTEGIAIAQHDAHVYRRSTQKHPGKGTIVKTLTENSTSTINGKKYLSDRHSVYHPPINLRQPTLSRHTRFHTSKRCFGRAGDDGAALTLFATVFLTLCLCSVASAQTLINTATAFPDDGYSYVVAQDFGTPADTMQATNSKLRIFENGRELRPAHADHADIRALGMGRFSHWYDGSSAKLYFSASDNTNPRTNDRVYTYQIDSVAAADPSSAFYVSPSGSDSNPGSLVAPWRTIQHAARTLVAGDTAIILDGVYVGPQITFANSGTANNPITIRAQNKWNAIVSSTAGCNPSFSIDKSYITIENVRIRSAPGNPACAAPSSADAAIRAWGSRTPTLFSPSTGTVGFIARGVFVDPGRTVGIKTNQDFSVVENSRVHNSIEVFNNQGTIFRNNVTYGADAWGGMVTAKGGARNFQAYNNVIHVTTPQNAGGLVLGGSSSCCMFDPATAFECYNCVAYNNVVINETGRTGVGLYGFRTCKNCTIFNNVGIKGQLFVRSGGPASSGQTVNSAFKNNIITCDSSGAATGGYNGWQNFQNLTVDYNNFYQCRLAEPGQSHAVAGDPMFVNPASDWHLQPGSAAFRAGVVVNILSFNGQSIDVSRNKDGNLRTVPPSLGIY